MDRDRDNDQRQLEDRETQTDDSDASGTARDAAARDRLPDDTSASGPAAAAVGLTGHMGESDTSPGLAGDRRDDGTETDVHSDVFAFNRPSPIPAMATRD